MTREHQHTGETVKVGSFERTVGATVPITMKCLGCGEEYAREGKVTAWDDDLNEIDVTEYRMKVGR